MKHLLLLLTIVLSLKVVSAQDSLLSKAKLPRTLYYIDDYLDYRNKVGDFDHASAKAYIKNGKFFYTSKLENNAHTTWMSFNIDPAMNCYVEMEFEQTEGKETQGCGLIFNHTTTKKNAMWKFLVSKDRSFLILKKQDDKDVEICPWTKCNYLQYWGNNRIAYFMKGNQIYFYINDHLVFNCKRPTYMGSDVGFQVGSASTIAVDKFTIRYNPLAVKDIPDGRYGYKKEDLGKNINSELDESFPVVSADGKLMFFSRATNFGSIEYDKRTIMYSEKDEATGEWSMAKPLPPNINQARKPQLISVSPDKNSIVITGSFSKSGKYLNDDGVAVSYRTKSGWTDPVNIVIPGYVT